jgi:glycine oxidase
VPDVAVLGAGAIGAAIAWRCAQRGLSVTVVDPHPDRGAWRTAAGMLAPITELEYTETPLLRLNLDSLARYPAFTADLFDATGRDTGYRGDGTLEIAWDGADLAALRDLHTFLGSLGLPSQLLSGREVRSLEPSLASGLPGGLLADTEHHVHPRLQHEALLDAGRRLGVTTVVGDAAVSITGDRVDGLRLDDGSRLAAPHVVIAAGAWSGRVRGVPPEAMLPVRPVKGQTLLLRLPGASRLGHVVRAKVKGNAVYLVPRDGGRTIVGASVDEAGFDQQPRAGAVYELLRDAQSVVPELGEAVLDEISTGLRPGSPDHAPLIGPSGPDGLIVATGHYRNGILLTPVTADLVAGALAGEPAPDWAAPADPLRFAGVPA